ARFSHAILHTLQQVANATQFQSVSGRYGSRTRTEKSQPPLSTAALGPDRSLVGAAAHPSHALVDKLLHALTLVGLGRVDVALGVGGDRVDAEKLAGLASAAAEAGQFRHRRAIDNANALVLPVGQIDEALPRIARERDLPG